ncbi:three-helix bundle dimerization domain-containing protein [Modestobacter marinus]|uniref:three-helix bundle dimerization domain-containing protein n=1 Tax=Modestobacter marinus TaxID=477641 RepID=UPI001C95A694|nr:hypothetical protein [Modestobacter marinus]
MTRSRIPSPSPSVDDLRIDLAVDLAVDRLAEEFDDRAETQTVVDVVRTCRNDLSGVPATALPELVERLARHRLLVAVG